MDERQIANAAWQFLQRTQLRGDEVPTFVMVIQWLQEKQQEQPGEGDNFNAAKEAEPVRSNGAATGAESLRDGVRGDVRGDVENPGTSAA